MPLFTYGGLTTNSKTGYVRTTWGYLIAASESEALGFALTKARANCPAQEGWGVPDVGVRLIPNDVLREALRGPLRIVPGGKAG